MSAEISSQLICHGVGKNVSPRDISTVHKEQLDRLITRMIQVNVGRFGFAGRALACDS